MDKYKKSAIAFILTGICLALVTLFNAEGYEPNLGVLYNVQHMYITIADRRPVAPNKLAWKYTTAEEIAMQNESTGGLLLRALAGGRELLKKDPDQFAKNSYERFETNMTFEDFKKALLSGEKIRIAEKEWKEAILLPYRLVATVSALFIFLGVGILIFKKAR
jgi:hypothetical protein